MDVDIYSLLCIYAYVSMAWHSSGRDAVRKGGKPFEWLERRSIDQHFHWMMEPRFLENLKSIAKDRQVKVSAT